ncbi:MAG TPA: histidine kinase [Bacillota bacterium]
MEKIINFIKNLSVSWKFILAYFSILIVPVVLMGIFLYIQNSNSAINQAKLVMEQNLLQTKASIVHKEKVIENLAQVLSNTKFVNFLNSGYENDISKVEDYQFDFSPAVKSIIQQDNAIYSIRIYMDKVIVTEMLDSYYSIRAMQSPNLFADASRYEPKVYGWKSIHDALPHLLKANAVTPVQVFSYSKGIYLLNYQHREAVLEFEVREDVLFDMLRDPVISKLGKVFIVDSDHRIISNNLPGIFKKDITNSGFNDFETGKKISVVKEINGVKSIVISIPLEGLRCSIVGIFPVSNFNVAVKKSLINIILMLFISTIILGFIVYFITNALLGRLKKLAKAMRQVREENLDVSVPVKTMDEFGELALSFNHMTRRIHELVEMVYKIQIIEREAELKAWESQINPHFLYNTLATISWAARKAGSQEIVKISNSLSKFYRLVLSKGNSLIYVREELDMVKAFLQIQKIRFEDKFDVEYVIDENILDCRIIKNILQPLVENALNHGIEPKRMHGTIVIKAWYDPDKLCFQIIDDGVGMDSSTLNDIRAGKIEKSGGSGYAIKNIMERLKAYYRTGQTFDVFSRPGIGTVVTITICTNDSLSEEKAKAGGFYA